jgi:hypothetical protein
MTETRAGIAQRVRTASRSVASARKESRARTDREVQPESVKPSIAANLVVAVTGK